MKKHGKANKIPEYSVWKGIRKRCLNKNTQNYHRYGGRGIKVCKRWDRFDLFLLDMGARPTPEHTIERIKNNLGYNPKNCKWLHKSQQHFNTRQNFWITFNGQRKTLGQWSRALNIKAPTLCLRLQKWTIEKALTQRLRQHKPYKKYHRKPKRIAALRVAPPVETYDVPIP